MKNSISIIFPCYNEEDRLKYAFADIKKFYRSKKFRNFEIIFVNDGSTDNTLQVLKNYKKSNKFIKNRVKILSYQNNFGKGFALKTGVRKARHNWILTLDTDISVSITQINEWIKKINLKGKKYIYFGSRNLAKSKIRFKFYRKLIGLVFIKIIKIFFNISLFDTQCGFKLYDKKTAKKIFSDLNSFGFAHDIEIVMLANSYDFIIKELPVKWIHKSGSKISLIKDSFRMLIALVEIKIRFILK